MEKIYSINGPVVTVYGAKCFQMMEMVYVGALRLIGEVIMISDEKTTIQVYEDTSGLKVGEPVEGTGGPICALLGPGILTNIFDGIERPLRELEKQSGAFIAKGIACEALDVTKKWDVTIWVQTGDQVRPGEIFATTQETSLILHKSMIPPDIEGTVVWAAANGAYTVTEPILKVEGKDGTIHDVALAQRWPIKTARPIRERLAVDQPLLTGQRVIDTMFPIGKGGAAAIPGGFGTGKTMTQHQIAKWSDADIIIYIGCGERGNEMTQVLEEFGELIDPKSGKPLTDRTSLIANTSNMPVAAREASIYTGITLAEYYRDMGYHVAIMADSTSRWAEALREISGRLEEMPAEEGFPAYLPSRLSQFYERAGFAETLSGNKGSVTIIGAVSPQGGDFSEPVTQNTKRFIRCFWALDRSLAYSRHYPAIHWVNSYTEYLDDLTPWYAENVRADFMEVRGKILGILLEENHLLEIVKLIGKDVLPEDQKLSLETAALIREGFLQQNAYHDIDTYVPIEKQYRMMETILYLHECALPLVRKNIPVSMLTELGLFEKLSRMKYDVANDNADAFDAYKREIDDATRKLLSEYEG